MSVFEELIANRWILKSKQPILYYQIKDSYKEISKFIQDKLGYTLVINPHLIKLEKIPGHVQPWMGIQEFSSIDEYQMFCFILMFLEDKEIEEQFVLSNLTEFIQTQFPPDEINWTRYTTRRKLIRVIKYCLKIGIFIQTDGVEEAFTRDVTAEVLYENLGTSRYFIRNFVVDIMEYNEPSDFYQSEWFGMNEERGIIRRQRVYRKLLLSPGVYRFQDQDDDFSYIRSYRHQIESDFQSVFSCDLHVHSSSAYLILSDETRLGRVFPEANTYSDIALHIHSDLKKKYRKIGEEAYEVFKIDSVDLEKIIHKIIKNNHPYLGKTYQEKEISTFSRELIDYMVNFGFIEKESMDESYLIYPIIGKLSGQYQGMEEK